MQIMSFRTKSTVLPISIRYCLFLVTLYMPIIPILCATPFIIARLAHYPLIDIVGLRKENFFVFVILTEAISTIVIFTLLYKKLGRSAANWRQLGFRKFSKIRALKYVAAYPVIILTLVILLAVIAGALGVTPPNGTTTPAAKTLNLMGGIGPAFFVAVLVAPLVEETIFRGILFPHFKRRYGVLAGVMISTILFAVIHINPVQVIATFFVGLYICFMYQRLDSIYPGMILHALSNAAVLYIAASSI